METSLVVTVSVLPFPEVLFDTTITVYQVFSDFPLTEGLPTGGNHRAAGSAITNSPPQQQDQAYTNISYVFIVNNGCSDTARAHIKLEICGGDGLLNFDSWSLTTLPNPAKGNITISNPGEGKGEVRIWLTGGMLVLHEKLETRNMTPETESWFSGVYIVEVKTQTKTFSEKLIIQ